MVANFAGLHFGQDGNGTSLVIILRGVPGCGKSTFAAQVKVFAQAHNLETEICSDDEFLRTVYDHDLNPVFIPNLDTRLTTVAQRHCMQFFHGALRRHVPVVILDNANITRADWQPYVDRAQRARFLVQKVSFPCDSLAEAEALAARSFSPIDQLDVAHYFRRFGAYTRPFESDEQILRIAPVLRVEPIVNAWDDEGAYEANRAIQ